MTSDLQFAFKEHHSTVLCGAVLIETVSYFRERGSDVYCCLLAASKAFARINYGKLFNLLLRRGKLPIIVRLILLCYTRQSVSVEWNKLRSESLVA